MVTMITQETTREELVACWHANLGEMVDAFIAANVDPDDPSTETEEIRRVIIQWIEDGDECAACSA